MVTIKPKQWIPQTDRPGSKRSGRAHGQTASLNQLQVIGQHRQTLRRHQ
jgi:hypothetical protein